ncbi:hypothetical protein Tco_0854487 [Tanacetum coccineum]
MLTYCNKHQQRSTSSTRWSLANADHLTFVVQGKLASGYVCEVTALGAYHSMLIGSDFLLEHMLLEGCQQTRLDKGISPVRGTRQINDSQENATGVSLQVLKELPQLLEKEQTMLGLVELL